MPRNPRKVKIGVIVAGEIGLSYYTPLFLEIIKPDLMAYVDKLPDHRFRPDLEFEFQLEHADFSDAVHLEKVQEFHDQGVDLIIGGYWSSQARASREYVNDNGLLLFSPSSTSTHPELLQADNLYRMCPDDFNQGVAIAAMLKSKDITRLVVIQRGDEWGDGLYGVLEENYSNGYDISLRIRYDPETVDFSAYLAQTEAEAANLVDEHGAECVGILLLSFDEAVELIRGVPNYPTLWSLKWFGADGTAGNDIILDEVPEEADHLKIFSTYSAPERSSKYNDMAERYTALTESIFGFYQACATDIAWVIAQAVLETQSSDARPLVATDIIEVIPDITSRFFGYSGWCLLNENGDRFASNYDIWGYGYVNGEPSSIIYGLYDAATGQITWFT
jgi:branched-chain amino acid transport system substrate-binding protein